jgi:hypothetical protein
MAVQIALDKEVRIRKMGQPINRHVIEPVYAFDKLVVPVGTTASGHITKIEDISNDVLPIMRSRVSPLGFQQE